MPGSPAYSAVLFDLDGTIVDSAPGITATLAYTFEKLGLPVPAGEGGVVRRADGGRSVAGRAGTSAREVAKMKMRAKKRARR